MKEKKIEDTPTPCMDAISNKKKSKSLNWRNSENVLRRGLLRFLEGSEMFFLHLFSLFKKQKYCYKLFPLLFSRTPKLTLTKPAEGGSQEYSIESTL